MTRERNATVTPYCASLSRTSASIPASFRRPSRRCASSGRSWASSTGSGCSLVPSMSVRVSAARERIRATPRERRPEGGRPRRVQQLPPLEGSLAGTRDPALEHPRRRPPLLAGEVALQRGEHLAFLLLGEAVGEPEALRAHRGTFPCLRGGTDSRFVASIRSAFTRRGRVSAGSITSST